MELVFYRGVRINRSVVGQVEVLLHGHSDVRLTSGYRDRTTNARVGGAARSYHLLGRAIDIVGPRATLHHLEHSARRMRAREVIDEGDHLHVAF